METKKIIFDNSSKHPEILITEDGHLSISGNSISVRPEDSFVPLIKWLTSYTGSNLTIEIDLNIINCGTVKLLLQAIVAADNNTHIKKRSITWFFKDEESQELGEMIFSNVNNSKFKLYCKN